MALLIVSSDVAYEKRMCPGAPKLSPETETTPVVSKIYKHKSIYIESMGNLAYLSMLKYVDCVIGNSSSGIVEAPTFRTATINIGNRQNVIHPLSCNISFVSLFIS